jgi:hypothetical protein
VGRLTTFGVTTGILWIVAVSHVDAAPHVGFGGPGVAPRAPEIMLYFSHSIGGGAAAGGGSMRPTFGLRVQQVRQGANSGDPEASGDPMQHRELLNWQMQGHSNLHSSDFRVKLGNRLTYDLTNRRFGSPSARSVMQIGLPTQRNSQNAPQVRAGFVAATAQRPVNREQVKDSSGLREMAAAAMSALSPARFTSAQRQMAQRPGGIAGITAAQRIQGTHGVFANVN